MKKTAFYSIVALMFIIGAVVLVQYFYDYYKVNEEAVALRNSAHEEIYTSYENSIGWINIDGMRLDNPIMQGTDNSFYLSHNYKGEQARTGSIFLDYRNNTSLNDRHSIIYGHDLRNGSMFGQLDQFADQAFANEHKYITIELLEGSVTLEVFAAYHTNTEFYYIETKFTDHSFQQFIDTIQSKSEINMGVEVNSADQIITLSTCTASVDDKERFVVHAKIVERK